MTTILEYNLEKQALRPEFYVDSALETAVRFAIFTPIIAGILRQRLSGWDVPLGAGIGALLGLAGAYLLDPNTRLFNPPLGLSLFGDK